MKNNIEIGINTFPIIINSKDECYRCYKNNKNKYLVFDSLGNNLGWKSFEELEQFIPV